MKTRLRNIEITCEQTAVELLNIEQVDLEVKASPVDSVVHQTMKRKCVVGTGGDRKMNWNTHDCHQAVYSECVGRAEQQTTPPLNTLN